MAGTDGAHRMTTPAGHIQRLEAALADRYRIQKKLGEGGMASVYLAEDVKHQRKVAVKVLRPELAAVIGAERFLSEITTTAKLQHMPAVSPDGRWIAYVSGDTGGPEIYVEPFPGLGRRFKVTTGGAVDPVWSPDGRRLYFQAQTPLGYALEAVDVVVSANGFEVGEPEDLFDANAYTAGGTLAAFDIHPDGTHFIFIRIQGRENGRQTQVVITNALNPGRTGER